MIRNIFSRFTRRRLGLAAVLAVAVAGSAVAGLLIADRAGRDSAAPPAFRGTIEPFQPSQSPATAPEIAFTDAAGRKLSLADFRGKVVLLNFWATWCGPCVEEMPSLDRLEAQLGSDRFAVVAISVDRQGLDVVKPFLAKTAVRSLATYLDPAGASMRAFGVRGLPTTFIIDRDGREAGKLEGAARWDTPEARALIRHYIGPAPASTTRADARH